MAPPLSESGGLSQFRSGELSGPIPSFGHAHHFYSPLEGTNTFLLGRGVQLPLQSRHTANY
jgi:hypothetical protein